MLNFKSKPFLSVIVLTMIFLVMPGILSAEDLNNLNQEIEDKQEQAAEIKKQAGVYQEKIRQKQEESISLQNQIEIIENKIAKTELDMQSTEIEVEQVRLEARKAELDILKKEDKIDNQKHALTEMIRQIHSSDQENALKIFLLKDSLSDFFNEVEYTKELQSDLKNSLQDVKKQKIALLQEKEKLEQKQEQLEDLKKDLELQQVELNGETEYKEILLTETKESEHKFTQLYWQAKKEQEAISSEITALEKEARKKLKQKKQNQPQLTDATLSWPVPKNKITAYFHDPSYPFRYLLEHPAIDIRAAQGTTITAPADGYVLKAKDAGLGYSYLSIIHADNISTVYGHVSKFYVQKDEFVAKGEPVALTGGMPGTPGAGRLSTGPHLHFEVRLNGIPVSPLNYLP